MIHEVNGWEEDDDCYWDDDDGSEEDEWVLVCGYPECCMPGYHYRSECHSGADLEAQERHATRSGKRCPDGDWLGDREPGGMECGDCGCIFISNEGRPSCKVCHDARSQVQHMAEQKP